MHVEDELIQAEEIFYSREIRERADIADRQAKLASFISRDVIPRLIQLHSRLAEEVTPSVDVDERSIPKEGDLEEFAEILLGDDLEASIAYVAALRDLGLPVETVYLELFGPTARLLGELWERDECDFIDVTIGVGRLQHLLSIFSRTHSLPDLASKRDLLVALAPGNQHSLGATTLEQFFAAAGWQVQSDLSGEPKSVVERVNDKWFALVGLSAGSEGQLEPLGRLIRKIREKSVNRRVGIMVGGPIFRDRPKLCDYVGADVTCGNAPTAVLTAQQILDAQLAEAKTINCADHQL
ncbi:B12-binding domain-containing protein [Altererythrobacter sp. GH1-8]|uniref:cobalamin B12-binding domain-containing protein n=1 Tax=Altererythrobacter sp. GH1-8 TaxID=3349333 RepID=UPI00374DEA6B